MAERRVSELSLLQELMRKAVEASINDPSLFVKYVEHIEIHICSIARLYPPIGSTYTELVKEIVSDYGYDPSLLPNTCRIFRHVVELVRTSRRKKSVFTAYDEEEVMEEAASICFEAITSVYYLIFGLKEV